MLLAVVDTHTFAAEAAQHAALEQGAPFANRSRTALHAVGLGIFGETGLVRLEALPVNVSTMVVREDELPVIHLHLDLGHASARPAPAACAAIDESAGISRIMQNLQNAGMAGRGPEEFTLVGLLALPSRKHDAFVQEEPDGACRAPEALERVEDQAQRVLHFDIGIQVKDPIRTVHQSHWRSDLKFAAASLVELTAAHPSLEDMKFGFAHRPFRTHDILPSNSRLKSLSSTRITRVQASASRLCVISFTPASHILSSNCRMAGGSCCRRG